MYLGPRRALLRSPAIIIPSAPPVLTPLGTYEPPSFPTGSSTLFSGLATGTAAADRLLIVVVTAADAISATIASGVFEVSGEADTPFTITVQPVSISNGIAAVLQATVPLGTSANLRVQWSGDVFSTPVITLYSVPSSSLTSTTATGTQAKSVSATTTESVDVATTSGGIIVAGAIGSGGVTGDITGDESWPATEDYNAAALGGRQLHSHVDGASSNASNTVTATLSGSAPLAIVAAAWR